MPCCLGCRLSVMSPARKVVADLGDGLPARMATPVFPYGDGRVRRADRPRLMRRLGGRRAREVEVPVAWLAGAGPHADEEASTAVVRHLPLPRC
jgi:hypothetical protein